MGLNWLSAMVAGVTAAVFWTSFSLWFGDGDNLKQVGMWAVIFLVGTTAVSFVIAQAISARTGTGSQG